MQQMPEQVVSSTASGQPNETIHRATTTCCIVGGPAGAVLALLLARHAIPVTLLEAHLNFERAFRDGWFKQALGGAVNAVALRRE